MSDMIKIAVDAMGGDGSPKKIIDGIILNHKSNNNIFFKIFGDENRISKLIEGKVDKKFYQIHHTENVVKSTDSPLEGAKRGKDTSMWLAIESVKNKEADIVVSAGNTGALLVISKLNLKMIDNIDKPALSALWPNKKSMSVVLDLGANIECSSKNLLDFSIMGASLFTSLYPNDKPNVALLNIGSEEFKGNETIKSAGQLIQRSNLNYAGFVEGDDIFSGKFDVIVTDGFAGNIALKSIEGVAKVISHFIKTEFTKNIFTKLSAFISLPVMNSVKKKVDPRKYNGASLLGLQGIVVKSHGGADSYAFSQAISTAYFEVKNELLVKIESSIQTELANE